MWICILLTVSKMTIFDIYRQSSCGRMLVAVDEAGTRDHRRDHFPRLRGKWQEGGEVNSRSKKRVESFVCALRTGDAAFPYILIGARINQETITVEKPVRQK